MMSQFCLIGNAPSSGSTLLADLLDSTEHSACGPELEFFCNKLLYDFGEFKKNPSKTSAISTLKSTGVYPNYNRLQHYNLDKEQLFKMVKNSDSLTSFFNQFSDHFLTYRNKNQSGIVFEKTPQNVNVINEFLTNADTGYFIYIVRNPLYVYNSLLNRGWGNYLALCTWLITAAHISKYINNPRVKIIKYEELIERPFETASQLIFEISGNKVKASQIEKNYQSNEYRKNSSTGLNTWEAPANRNEVINANEKEINENVKGRFSVIQNLKVSSSYAQKYSIDELSFKNAIKLLGYESLSSILPKSKKQLPQKTFDDRKKLTMKWLREIKNGDSSLLSRNKITNAVEII
ncbi:MAG: sulfotransferase [Flavobacteriales bacterium]|nr:sulfotransferase [Flavobacteriales bacterium]